MSYWKFLEYYIYTNMLLFAIGSLFGVLSVYLASEIEKREKREKPKE